MCEGLHRGGEEGGVAEDVENILGGGDEERLALLDADAVDVGFAPEADYHDKRIGVQIDLGGYLYDHAMDGEVRTMDEFGVGFGGVVGSSVLRPYLVVDGFLGLLYMQFPRVTVCILASEVIDAVGDIGGFLYLDKEITGSDSVESSGG